MQIVSPCLPTYVPWTRVGSYHVVRVGLYHVVRMQEGHNLHRIFFHLTTFPFSRVLNPLLQPPSFRDPPACREPHLRPLHPCLHTRLTGRLLRLPPPAGSQDSPQGADWPHLACGGHVVSMATACPAPFRPGYKMRTSGDRRWPCCRG